MSSANAIASVRFVDVRLQIRSFRPQEHSIEALHSSLNSELFASHVNNLSPPPSLHLVLKVPFMSIAYACLGPGMLEASAPCHQVSIQMAKLDTHLALLAEVDAGNQGAGIEVLQGTLRYAAAMSASKIQRTRILTWRLPEYAGFFCLFVFFCLRLFPRLRGFQDGDGFFYILFSCLYRELS